MRYNSISVAVIYFAHLYLNSKLTMKSLFPILALVLISVLSNSCEKNADQVNTPSSCISLLSPSDGDMNVPLGLVLFRWYSTCPQDSFELQIDESSSFAEFDTLGRTRWILRKIKTRTDSAMISLNANTVYYWRVRAISQQGNSAWSTVRRFKKTLVSARFLGRYKVTVKQQQWYVMDMNVQDLHLPEFSDTLLVSAPGPAGGDLNVELIGKGRSFQYNFNYIDASSGDYYLKGGNMNTACWFLGSNPDSIQARMAGRSLPRYCVEYFSIRGVKI